jgi:hypothetical protein
MNRSLLLLGFCGIALATHARAFAAPVVVPAGLPAGAPYRLAFVSNTAETANSTDIADYNAFVTGVANSDPLLASLGTTWSAIVSTSTVDARDNTNTNPASLGVPIYNLDGQLVATSNVDLWDGTIANAILYDQNGDQPPPGNQVVWTGTQPAGIAAEPLGIAFPSWGEGNYATRDWVFSSYGTYGADRNFLFYGISGVLTAVPEPSTLALAAFGGLALLLRLRLGWSRGSR